MDDVSYRPTSGFAIASIVMAVLSLSGLFMMEAALIGIPAFVIAAVARQRTRKYELRGRSYAAAAMMLSLATMTLIPAGYAIAYAMEAPAGYERRCFSEIVKRDQMESLIGKQVCLKGYVVWRSSKRETAGSELMCLSSDGDWQRHEASTEIEPQSSESLRFRTTPLAVSGTIELNPAWSKGSNLPKYRIRNSVIRDAWTSFDLAPHVPC